MAAALSSAQKTMARGGIIVGENGGVSMSWRNGGESVNASKYGGISGIISGEGRNKAGVRRWRGGNG